MTMRARDGEGEDSERYGGPVLAAIRPRALGSLNGLTLVTGSHLHPVARRNLSKFSPSDRVAGKRYFENIFLFC